MISKAAVRYRARNVYISIRRTFGVLFVDRRRGLDTTRELNLQDVGLAHPERVRYEPTGWIDLKRTFRACPVEPGDVFLDYGSGKGRVLLAAARKPFARVVGVEISSELCDVARVNLETERDQRRCGAVEVVAADVTEWDVPDDVTVIFMHNPFRGEIFDAAMKRVLASLDRSPRRLRVIYRVPMEEQRLLATRRARLVRSVAGLRPSPKWSRKVGTRIYELGVAPD
jgi:SAM-dependent methyltransferase